MKKVLYGILILIGILTVNVKAANYELKELIPENIKTTIVTNSFSYREFYYNPSTKSINFKSIKNLSDKELPVSISIALFDENKKNLSVINYCDRDMLAANTEKAYTIKLGEEDMPKDHKIDEVKYIAVISDNTSCTTGNFFDYVGQDIDDIGMFKNRTFNTMEERTFLVIGIVIGFVVLLFLYNFMFTSAYQNMDGEDVRIGYKQYNKELEDERKRELKRNPPKPKEKVKVKTDEVIAQEERAKNTDKTSTDLHNLYK
ncbi:MAG: hypothetical protein IKE63_00785 [Bacilli bacterium]|nr:hypothetical protein [Bacilli bacterium]